MRKIIYDDIFLNDLHLTELFDLSDVEVTGDFWCCSNNLTNLEGAPQIVRGSFYCYENNLTSLKGIPKIIGDTTRDREAISDGIPNYFKGNLYIDKVLKDKFPEEYIRSLCEIEGSVRYT